MFNNPYYNAVSNVPSVERIDAQIQELQRQRTQAQQFNTQPSINQTFQLAPSNTSLRLVNNQDEVQRELVFGDTAFFSKDLSVVWIKNAKGEIRAFEMKEVIQKDEKDLLIDELKLQIEEMKKNEQSSNNINVEPTKVEKSSNGKTDRKFNK